MKNILLEKNMMAKKLKSLRQQHDLKVETLSSELFIDKFTISRLEKGKVSPTLNDLIKYSNYFGVPLDDLIIYTIND